MTENGAGKSVTVPKGLKLYSRVGNGVTGPGTFGEVTAAGFQPCNTVIEPGMLPETLRHRFRPQNFKEFRWYLTD